MKARFSTLVKSFVVASLVMAAGCDRVADDQTKPTAGRDGCDALAEAVTAYVQKCLPSQAIVSVIAQRFAAECKMVAGAPGVTGFGATLAACEAAYESAAETCAPIDAAPCLPPRGALLKGAPCGADAQCASGLCSVPGGSGAPSAYFSFAAAQNETSPAAGVTRGACGTCAPCDGACASGLVCQQGTCAPPPPGDVGQSCADHLCKNGLQCDALKFTCTVPPAEGEGCIDARDPAGVELGCAAPFVCQLSVGVMGTCARGSPEGGQCSPSGLPCARGLQCELPAGADPNDPAGGTCSAASHIPAAGQPCEGAQVCTYAICALASPSRSSPAPSLHSPGRCPVPIPDGQACDADDQKALRAPCNYFSECIASTCVLFDPGSCK